MEDKKDQVEEIVKCLLSGGIVLMPTDTVYGLAVSPNFEKSVDRLYALKRRPRNLHLPIMVASPEDLKPLGIHINGCVRKLMTSSFVPGALTIAVGFSSNPLVPWLEGREEVAIRVPDDKRLLEVLKKTGPLLVTSANRNGTSTPDNIQEILAQLDGVPDKIIDGGYLNTIPSTLINCRYDPPVVEREGSISQEELFELLGDNV